MASQYSTGASGGSGGDGVGWAGPAISAGANLVGGTLDQTVFQPKQQQKKENRQARHAAQLEPFVEELMNFDTSGLRAQASQELSQGSSALNAQLSQRGLFDSGVAMQQQRQLTGDVLGDLARDIEASRRARTQAAAGIVGNAPGYGQDVDPVNSSAGWLGAAGAGVPGAMIGSSLANSEGK